MSCAAISGGLAEDVELLPAWTPAVQADYRKIVLPCEVAAERWVPIAKFPEFCTYVAALEEWIGESRLTDSENRATLGR